MSWLCAVWVELAAVVAVVEPVDCTSIGCSEMLNADAQNAVADDLPQRQIRRVALGAVGAVRSVGPRRRSLAVAVAALLLAQRERKPAGVDVDARLVQCTLERRHVAPQHV